MSGKLIAPCSLTKLMFSGEGGGAAGYVIDFPEPLPLLVFRYKLELQKLQLEIIDSVGSDNLEGIGHCFEKLELAIDCLIEYSAENINF